MRLADPQARTRSPVHEALHRLQVAAERSNVEWLIYNPLKMAQYHALARRDAAALIAAVEQEFPDAARYADVGAGSGAFSAQALRRGHPVVALERSAIGRLMARAQGVDARPFSLERQPPARAPWPVDLALCLEVAEHIPPALSAPLVRFLTGLAPAVVFTSAPPGQGGTGHVNEQPPEYWEALFAQHGAAHATARTAALRAAFLREGVVAPWYVQNVRVYERRAAATCGS